LIGTVVASPAANTSSSTGHAAVSVRVDEAVTALRNPEQTRTQKAREGDDPVVLETLIAG